MARGVLAIWHDFVPEHEMDILAWYDREHHFERLAVPGFRDVRRYHAETGTAPRLFIRYETDSAAVLDSPAYLERLNRPTPWTLRCQPQFLNNSRTVCERAEMHGHAEGGVVATVRLSQAAPETLLDSTRQAAEIPGILGWEHWTADLERATIPTQEKQLRGGEDRYAGAVLVLHARGQHEAAAGLAKLASALTSHPELGAITGIYRLAFSANFLL